MYGDGVFRTIAVRSGRARNWPRHFRLLAQDCERIGLPAPDESTLRGEIARVAPDDATVKVVLTRGASGRGYAFPENIAPNRIVVAYPPTPAVPDEASAGVRVRRCRLVLSEQPLLAGIKSLNRLENVLARAEWRDPGIREGLLVDARERLVEGTMSNVFLTVRGTLVTPDLSRCGVSGSQRERVLDFARAEAIPCEIRDVEFGEIREAGEVFLTNSVIGILPVVALDERRWSPGPVARRMQRLVEDDDALAS
jgi:4-amino-4-deoxychorismate lyase